MRTNFKMILAGCLVIFSSVAAAEDRYVFTDAELKTTVDVYMNYCSKCHGPKADGQGRMRSLYLQNGSVSPSDFNNGVYRDRPESYLRKMIVEGGANNKRSEFMPPFEGELSGEQIDALVKLIKYVSYKGFPNH